MQNILIFVVWYILVLDFLKIKNLPVVFIHARPPVRKVWLRAKNSEMHHNNDPLFIYAVFKNRYKGPHAM